MAVLCFLLTAVCLMDYQRSRIPNGMMILIFLYGIGYRYWDAGGSGLTAYLFNFVFVLLLLYPLFKIGALGAGDVKLYSVTVGYLSKQDLFCFLMISLLFAAIFSIFKLIKEGSARERFGYLCSYLAQIGRTGHWKLYFSDAAEAKKAGICMAGPIFLSLLLHIGGIY